jgi:DNA-binding response OmpR family regulator
MPEPGGLDVCRAIRARGDDTPILMLTARDLVSDRVAGLDAGADDYLAKPFAFAELVARVRALSRRSPATPPVVVRGDLTVDRARRRVSRDGRPVTLTRKEFGVLEAVLGADGAVISAEELLESVWDEHADPFSNTVSVTIARLRRKLGEPPLIETVIGSGYRLRAT